MSDAAPICSTCFKPTRLAPHSDLDMHPIEPCPECRTGFNDGFSLAVVFQRDDWRDTAPSILYVVAYDDGNVREERPIFTLSSDPRLCGWGTDASATGYGLPFLVARRIATTWNEATR